MRRARGLPRFLRSTRATGKWADAAYDGDEPAGAGALFVHGRAAWLGIAGTRPEHRRKGSQGLLFAARIDKARELGVEVFATETGALEAGRPSNSYRNITRVGFAERYVRPNYTASGAGSSSSSGSRP